MLAVQCSHPDDPPAFERNRGFAGRQLLGASLAKAIGRDINAGMIGLLRNLAPGHAARVRLDRAEADDRVLGLDVELKPNLCAGDGLALLIHDRDDPKFVGQFAPLRIVVCGRIARLDVLVRFLLALAAAGFSAPAALGGGDSPGGLARVDTPPTNPSASNRITAVNQPPRPARDPTRRATTGECGPRVARQSMPATS